MDFRMALNLDTRHVVFDREVVSLLFRTSGAVSIADAQNVLKVNKFTLRDYFKRLVEEGHLIRVGQGRSTKYALKI